jgi:hypothetical protein
MAEPEMTLEIVELHRRIDKLEQLKNEEVLTLVEILANITFFGELNKTQCEHARNGQCSFFVLLDEAKGKIPIASNCRVKQCNEGTVHCHLELSNITCALCKINKNLPTETKSNFRKNIRGKKMRK